MFSDQSSLKYKLAMSHFSMVIIPIVLVFLAQWIYSNLDRYQEYSPEEQKGIIEPFNQILKFSGPLSEIQRMGMQDPDAVLAPENFFRYDSLAERGLILAILKDGAVVYKPEGLELLPRDQSSIDEWLSGRSDDGPLDTRNYMAIPFDSLTFTDGSSGQIYIMSPKPHRPDNSTRDTALLVVFGIALLINVWISYRVANNIVKPVQLLNRATGEIARGNLEHAIEYSSADEIGDLCQSFETMRQRLNEAEALKQRYELNRQELVANISHDLKTPLTSIRGYIQGIQDGVANTPEKLGKYTRTIYSNTLEMDRLIDDLFLFSRLDMKQLDFDLQKIDIEQYLLDCVEDKSLEMEQKGIQLSFVNEYTSGLPVIADGQRLKRVINNILSNAVQHRNPAAEAPSVTIRLGESENEALIGISDSGTGIAAEVLPHIFERHYRGEASRSRPAGGSGLGLAIARQIVEAHGGRIWAESPGTSGATICFTLPKWRDETARGSDIVMDRSQDKIPDIIPDKNTGRDGDQGNGGGSGNNSQAGRSSGKEPE